MSLKKSTSMKQSIIITGGDGKLASALREHNNTNDKFKVYSPSKHELDITSLSSVYNFFDRCNADYVIHAAAFTKPMKKHQEYPHTSIMVNIVGTSNVALGCLKYKTKLIYISTDYVYPGTAGDYSEVDPVSPYSQINDGICKYGWSKLGGECSVHLVKDFLILRACLCEYPFPHPSALKDVKKSLIYHHDAAPIIFSLLDETGVINLGGKSQSVYDFAKECNPQINELYRNDIKDVKIAPDTSMNTQKLQKIIQTHEN